jgi:HME family heavy-metal exporter
VIVGGLISSTLLDFFVHPALFWTLGLKAAQRVVDSKEQHIVLVEEGAAAA